MSTCIYKRRKLITKFVLVALLLFSMKNALLNLFLKYYIGLTAENIQKSLVVAD